jgi:hypothetical protein
MRAFAGFACIRAARRVFHGWRLILFGSRPVAPAAYGDLIQPLSSAGDLRALRHMANALRDARQASEFLSMAPLHDALRRGPGAAAGGLYLLTATEADGTTRALFLLVERETAWGQNPSKK